MSLSICKINSRLKDLPPSDFSNTLQHGTAVLSTRPRMCVFVCACVCVCVCLLRNQIIQKIFETVNVKLMMNFIIFLLFFYVDFTDHHNCAYL